MLNSRLLAGMRSALLSNPGRNASGLLARKLWETSRALLLRTYSSTSVPWSRHHRIARAMCICGVEHALEHLAEVRLVLLGLDGEDPVPDTANSRTRRLLPARPGGVEGHVPRRRRQISPLGLSRKTCRPSEPIRSLAP